MSENRTRFRLDQRRAPIYEALEQFRQMRVVPFDVPGHKRGRGNPELTAFLGQQCVGVDVNSMKPLDNLCHPVSDGQVDRCHDTECYQVIAKGFADRKHNRDRKSVV